MSKCFRTVLGDVDADKIGYVYTHEHLYCDPYIAKKDSTLAITDIDLSVKELENFRNAGGSTLVEATAIDYGRNPQMLVKASQASGIHVIATTGYYLYDFHPESVKNADPETLAELFIKEVTEGMGDTNIRAGQIKCAVSARFIHPDEEKLLRAAVRAQKVTNAPIWIHHGGMEGMEILDILEEEGADIGRVVLGHMDRNPDPYEYKKIAKRGCFMSIDNVARLYRYPVQDNVDMLKDLLDMGCLEKIMISADFGRTTYLESYGGGPGFAYLLSRFAPRIKEECHLSQKDIDTLFSKNPMKVYACF